MSGMVIAREIVLIGCGFALIGAGCVLAGLGRLIWNESSSQKKGPRN